MRFRCGGVVTEGCWADAAQVSGSCSAKDMSGE